MTLSRVHVCILWKATRPVRICIKAKYTFGVCVMQITATRLDSVSMNACLFSAEVRLAASEGKKCLFHSSTARSFPLHSQLLRVSSNPPVRGFNTLSGGRGGRRRILTLPGQTMGVLLGITAPGGLRGADLWLAPSVTGVCWGFGVGLHKTLSYTALLLFHFVGFNIN